MPASKTIDQVARIQAHGLQCGGDALADFMPLGAIDNRRPVPWNLILPGEDILGITPVCTRNFCGIGKPDARTAHIQQAERPPCGLPFLQFAYRDSAHSPPLSFAAGVPPVRPTHRPLAPG